METETRKFVGSLIQYRAKERKLNDKATRLLTTVEAAIREFVTEAAIQYTGWFVLLKRSEDSWVCMGTFNPDKASEGECAWFETTQFDLILPIPEPGTVPEFTGF